MHRASLMTIEEEYSAVLHAILSQDINLQKNHSETLKVFRFSEILPWGLYKAIEGYIRDKDGS